MKRPVATSEIVVPVRSFSHARRPAGGTPTPLWSVEEDRTGANLHPLNFCVQPGILLAVTPPPAIEAHGLVKRYGDKRALDGVELDVACGAVCALVGPNGAGKTTAVRLLTTLTLPDEGTARVAGHDVVSD